jgi:hypothetical protein
VETFGDSNFGRPRITGTDANRFTQYGVDKSGASSGSTQSRFVADFFAGIGFPHADDAPILAACGPNENHQAAFEPTDGYEAILAIVAAVVGVSPTDPGEHLIRQRHVDPAMNESGLPLGGVEADRRMYSCYYNKLMIVKQCLCRRRGRPQPKGNLSPAPCAAR